MPETVAELAVSLTADISDLKRGMEDAGHVLSGFSDSIGRIGGAIAGGLAALPIAGALNGLIASAGDGEDALALLTAHFNSAAIAARNNGQAIGMSVQSLDKLSNSLAGTTRYSDETVKRGEAMLLTFHKIGANIFPQATEAMLDMAATMGGDVQGAAIQLGKALEDPVKGISALHRVGVSFTDTQKKQIELFVRTGQVAKAQQIVLNELSSEFGGTAKAAAETFNGRLDQMRNSFDNLLEALGNPIVKALAPVLQGITKVIVEVTTALEGSDLGWIVFAAGIAGALAVAAPLIGMIGGIVAAALPLVAVVAGVGAAFAANFGGIRTFVEGAYAAIKPELDRIVGAVKGFWDDVFGGQTISKMGRGAFEGDVGDKIIPPDLGTRLSRAIAKHLPDIQTGLAEIGNKISQAWETNIKPAIDDLINKAGDAINNLLRAFGIQAEIKVPTLDQIGAEIRRIWTNVIEPAITGLRIELASRLEILKGVLSGEIKIPALEQIGETIRNLWNNVIEPAINTLKDGFSSALSIIRGILSGEIKVPALDTLKTLVETVWNAIKGTVGDIIAGVKGFIDNLSGADFSGVQTILETVGKALGVFVGAIGTVGLGILSALGKTLPTLGSALKDFLDGISKLTKGDWSGGLADVGTGLKKLGEGAASIPMNIAERIGDILHIDIKGGLKAWDGIGENIGKAIDAIKGIIAGKVNELKTAAEMALVPVREVFANIFGGGAGGGDEFGAGAGAGAGMAGGGLGDKIVQGLSGIGPKIMGFLEPVFGENGTVRKFLSDAFDPKVWVEKLQGIGLQIGSKLQNAFAKGGEVDLALQTAKGLFDGVFGPGAFDNIAGAIADAITKAKNWLETDGKKMLEGAFNALTAAAKSILGGIADGIIGAVKAGLKIIANLLRPIADAGLPGLSSAVGGVVGQLDAVAGRAVGGPVSGNTPYIVGERGPELFVPGSAGTIIPNHALGGAGGGTVNIQTVHMHGVQDAAALLNQLQAEARRRNISL